MNLRGIAFTTAIILLSPLAYGSNSWVQMQDLNHYNLFAQDILKWTHVLEAKENYVELSKKDLAILQFLEMHLRLEHELELKDKSHPKPTRGLASDLNFHSGEENIQWDQRAYETWRKQQGGLSVDSPQTAQRYCQTGSACMSDEQFHRTRGLTSQEYSALVQKFKRLEREGDGYGPTLPQTHLQSNSPGGFYQPINSSLTPQKRVLDPRDGDYRYHGSNIVECFGSGHCVVVGSVNEFEIRENGAAAGENTPPTSLRRNTSPTSPNQDYEPAPHSPSPSHNTSASAASGSTSSSSASRASGASSRNYQGLARVFRSCEEQHQRALNLCGSSYQPVNSRAVQSELNLRAGMQLATYLQLARAVNQSEGKSMYEICDASEKMARSMTALNAAYTGLCSNAQNACVTSCRQALGHMQNLRTSDQELELALSSTSSGFDPERMQRACQSDMNHQMQQGIFQTAQTLEFQQRAASCKAQLAGAGPCALPEMWNTQGCYDHCREGKNPNHPACARFTAIASHCGNPEFAAQNSFCLCLNHPADPSCQGGGFFPREELARGWQSGITPPPGGQSLPSAGRGSFGQSYESSQQGGQAPARAQEASYPAGGGAGTQGLSGQSSRSGIADGSYRSSGAAGGSSPQQVIDGVQNFGSSPRRAAPGKTVIYGDMNSKNPYRRIAIESDDPNFDLKQYLPPENFEANRAPRCYYGKDRIGCMHGPSLFDMVSRQYQKIRHEMME